MSKNLFPLFCLALIIAACNSATNIGEDLLNDEKLDLSYKNNFTIGASTILSPDALSFTYTETQLGETNLLTPETGIIGDLYDAKFGKIKSSVYSKIIFNPNLGTIPTFKDLTFDSAVMILAYDTLGNYGASNVVHNLMVEEISEDYADADSIYSSRKLTTSKVIGTKSFIPNSKDSITIFDHTDSTKQKLAAQIRVRMDDEWAKALYTNDIIKNGLSTTEANEKLYSFFKGVKISSTTEGKSLIGLNLNTQAVSSTGLTKLTFYLKEADGDKISYSFYFSTIKFNSFEIDRQGSEIEQYIDKPERSDSLVFLQSMTGPSFYLDLQDLTDLKDKIINHAAIEMTVANLADDNLTELPPVLQLMASKKVDGKYVIIKDVADQISNGYTLATGFGGALTGTTKKTYSINITKHLKELLEDESLDRKIYITANNRSIRPNRSIIYGPKHSQYPIKLKVAFAKF
jgi:Domain of unknown function (DUF4270)